MWQATAAAVEASADLSAAFVADSDEGGGDLSALLARVRNTGRAAASVAWPFTTR